MKKIINFIILSIITLSPLKIYATNANSDVWYGDNKYTCTSKYQDSSISTSDIAYFSYCMKATCENNNKYEIEYFYNSSELKNNNMIISCANGNTNPYGEMVKNGCNNLNSCSRNEVGIIKYCSVIFKYDCNRKSDGSSFLSSTKKTTKKSTTKVNTITTAPITTSIISTKLKSLSLSKGTIIFNSDTYEYDITLNEEDTSIDITAIPEDNNSKVEVSNNTNLTDGSRIEVKVTSPNNTSSVYIINIKKTLNKSNNANLKSLYVKDYDLKFNKTTNNYTLIIDSSLEQLSLNYELEDSKSTVIVSNNNNLENGSKITISVKAEDGTLKYYYINIIKKEKSNVFGIIFIIILILALIAGVYYLYVKFVANKRGEKYEYE